ncbi:MAG: hypothetical protein PWP23_2882 [Candidatus Sumerlaeota bacterium]|nr:hypothetical protein [Candidatus Sumerlaeota bacterium]
MTSFSEIRPEQIRSDCRFYTGYKPCHRHDGCPDCTEFQPRGREVLIIKLGAMGDVLRTKCILTGIKRQYPYSWITWLTAPGSEPLVRDPLVDEIHTYSTRGLGALEGRRFHLLACLDKDAEALALSRRIESARKVGYAPTDFNTLTVYNQGSVHALRLGLSDELKYRHNQLTHPQILYSMLEMKYQGDGYSLTVPREARELAAERLAALKLPAGKPVIGLNTGCGPVFETKQWTAEGYTELARRLARDHGFAVLLYGGPREAPMHAALLDALGPLAGNGVWDTGTDNSLETFFALVDRVDVLVSADTLAMHVAIALRKKVVAFFGPTCEQEVDLFGRGERIVTDYKCSPCYLKRCDVRPSCMQALTAETVEAAVVRVLRAVPATSG